MATDESSSQLCICGQAKALHTATTIHPFTPRDDPHGMRLPESQKQQQKNTANPPTNPTQQSLARLIGVLKDKNVIDDSDIVRIIGIPSFKEPQ